jgi:hypothetical protein
MAKLISEIFWISFSTRQTNRWPHRATLQAAVSAFGHECTQRAIFSDGVWEQSFRVVIVMLQKVKGFRFLCAAGNVKMNLQIGGGGGAGG